MSADDKHDHHDITAKDMAKDAVNVTSDIVGDIGKGISEAASGAVDVAKDGAGLIADVAGDLGDGVREGVVGAKEQMGKIVEGTVEGVTEVIDPKYESPEEKEDKK